MLYGVWDIDTGNLVSAYHTEEEALLLVRDAVRLHGPAYGATLSLSAVDAGGETEIIAEGEPLVSLALSSPARSL